MKYLIFALTFFSSTLSLSDSLSADDYLNKMTLKQKISQLFIFNIHKPVFDKQFKQILRKHRPGSYILFGKDILSAKSLYNLTHKLQIEYAKYNELPALLMIDQEGGHVTRINTRPNLPSPLSVSTSGDPSLSYLVGMQTSNILKELGINVNLAPVVDLSDPNKYNFIGNRSFGNDPDKVHSLRALKPLLLKKILLFLHSNIFQAMAVLLKTVIKVFPKNTLL